MPKTISKKTKTASSKKKKTTKKTMVPSIQCESKNLNYMYQELEKVANKMVETMPPSEDSNLYTDVFFAGMMLAARFGAYSEMSTHHFMGIAYEMCHVMESLQHTNCPHCHTEMPTAEEEQNEEEEIPAVVNNAKTLNKEKLN